MFGSSWCASDALGAAKKRGVFAVSPARDESLTNDMHRVPGGGRQLRSSWLMSLARRKELETIPGMKQKAQLLTGTDAGGAGLFEKDDTKMETAGRAATWSRVV